MKRVAKIHPLSETKTLRRAREKGLWWVLLSLWLTCLLVAGDKGWALDGTSLKGPYVINDLHSAFSGVDANGGWGVSDSVSFSRTEVTFDGAGTWSGTSSNYELERQITEITKNVGSDQVLSNKFAVLVPTPSSDTVSGTYALRKDGSGTVTHGEGPEPFFLSADGSVILLGKRQFDSVNHHAWLSMGVGVKKASIPRGMPWMMLLFGE